MTRPYLILSDIHFNNWSAFSKTNEDGINSRLQIQIDEIKRAVRVLKEAGGDTILNAGDTFHVRGRVDTTVLNPVMDLFKWISKSGVKIYSIPGNHDLAGKESDVIGNAANSLSGDRSIMADYITMVADRVIMFPWRYSVDELRSDLESRADQRYTAIIHAPVNGVIMNIPDHGLDAEYLGNLGYKRVFSGHYHNHVDFGNGVYSIGATTHQTWSDVGSKAGFLLVSDEEVRFMASHAPRFIDITSDMDDDEIPLLCDGNYVRAKLNVSKDSEVEDFRQWLMDCGAAGVSIHPVRDLGNVTRSGSTVESGASIQSSVAEFIKHKGYEDQSNLSAVCLAILSESEGSSE